MESPIEIAITRGLYDVALLLLCNGYRLDLESHPFTTPLDLALQRREWDFVDLLLEWGADPRKVDPDSVFGSYRVDVFDRFKAAGVDFVKGHALAWHLSEHSSNRPLYGWARRNKTDPLIARDLDIALLRAVNEKREKVIHLLLWAGANSRARVPNLEYLSRSGDEADEDCYSPMEEAASSDNGELLPLLKPDPSRDNLAELYAVADTPEVLKYLVSLQPPSDWSSAILRHLQRLDWPFRPEEPKACLDYIATQGGRLGVLSRDQCSHIRSVLLKLGDDSDVDKLLRWLSDPECCEPATYAEITRTQSIKTRLRRMLREDERHRRGW